MPPVAIIGVTHELAKLEARMTVLRSQDTLWGRLVTGHWRANGAAVALAGVAMGKVGAAMGAQALIAAVQPRLVLNCGSAGALTPDLHLGDIVVGDPVAVHDQGVFLPVNMASRRNGYRPDGFLAVGSTLPRSRRRSFHPDATLLDQAKRAAQRSGLAGIHVGAIVTGDQVILQDATRRWLRATFDALAVDNESAAVVQVAHCHGVPWLVIRGISDAADNDAAFDYTPLLVFEEDAPASGRLERMSQMISLAVADPATVSQVRRLRHGMRQAMASVATLLDVLLPLLMPGQESPG